MPVFLDEPRIRKLRLRILIEELHVGVRGCRVQIVVIFLHILAVIALASGESEQALLQNRIPTIPKSKRQRDELVTITNARKAVLAPAICPGSGMIMGEIIPCRAARAVVFPHRAPLSFAKVGSPPLPVDSSLPRFFEPLLFHAHQAPSFFCALHQISTRALVPDLRRCRQAPLRKRDAPAKQP